MTEENIAIRLKSLISNLGINSSVFADNCGISRATLSQLLTGRNKKINDVIISQIHKAYPALSILWLLFNEGEMWVDAVSDSSTVSSQITEQENGSSNNKSSNGIQNGHEILNFSDNEQGTNKYANHDGLELHKFEDNSNDFQSINSCIKTSELINEINNLKSKIRKVVQITIYYDDFTFESFFPEK